MIKTPLKIALAAALTVSGFTLAPAAAEAGPKYRAGHHFGGHHFKGHHYRYSPRHYRFRGHHRGHGAAIAGYTILGLTAGVLLYSAAKSSSYDRAYDRGYYRGARDAHSRYIPAAPPQVIVVPQAAAPAQPQAAPQAYAPPQGSPQGGFDYNQCREVREYQTTIYIDGQAHPATGRACLTFDGSWVAGPPSFGR